jgi:hypothetical protein
MDTKTFYSYLHKRRFSEMNLPAAFDALERPRRLYKFQSFDSEGYSLQNLMERQVWLSNPTVFNDPFDTALTCNNLKSKMPWLLHPVVTGDPVLAKYVEEMFVALERYAANNTSALFRANFKVSCFSERSDSILMWGHYADGHKGFCVEYDIAFYDNTARQWGAVAELLPIKYTADRFDATSFFDEALGGSPDMNVWTGRLAACHKAEEWAYEKEWRLVSEGRDTFQFPITKVTVGALCSPKDYSKLNSIVERLNEDKGKLRIVVTKMHLDPTKFSLIEESIPTAQ